MPTYLLHGFRWERQSIRIHIILHDLEDAAPEWIVAPASSVTLLNSFYTLFDFLPPSKPPPPASIPLATAAEKVVMVEPQPENGTQPRALKNAKKGSISSLRDFVRRPMSMGSGNRGGKQTNGTEANGAQRPISTPMPSTQTRAQAYSYAKPEKPPSFNDWSAVKLLEQHDPEDLAVVSQPYAYVADYMIKIPLGISISDEMAKYEARKQEEEGLLSMPATPATPATPVTPSMPEIPGTSSNATNGGSGSEASSITEKRGIHTPPLSAREIRRRSRRLGWIEKLRDELQKGGDIGWFVVHCGDEERKAPSIVEEEEEEEDWEESQEGDKPLRSAGLMSAGLMNFFGRRNIPEEK